MITLKQFTRFLIVIFLSLIYYNLPACTIIAAVSNGKVLIGNNEDYNYPFSSVWFIPSTEKEYGRVCFGFNLGKDKKGENKLAATGGMNDHGLFIDGNGLSETGYVPDSTKETYNGMAEPYILANCASVEEAIEWFKNTNVSILSRAKFLIADKTGASVVVEWGNKKLQFIHREKNYQISTNFVQSNYKSGAYPDYRYRTAEKIFQKTDNYTIETIRNILSLTHFEGNSVTLFSNIYDLNNGDIYIYNHHDFENVVKFNLREELEKGAKDYSIPTLFSEIPYSQYLFVPKATSDLILNRFDVKNPEKTFNDLKDVKELCMEAYNRDFNEGIVNTIGYKLIGEGKLEDAITFFTYNTEEYPESANTYDSLGEAYMLNNNTEMAIKNYKKSLELNPGNINAVEIIKKLDDIKPK